MTSYCFALAEALFGWPGMVNMAVFLVGWSAGWIGFMRAAPLPRSGGVPRRPVSIIVPCRNEAGNIGELLLTLMAGLRDGDEVVVVDDDSSDDTVAMARRCGATVVSAGDLPPGWAGKSYACWQGVQSARNDLLLFVDADVRVGPGAIDDVLALLDAHPNAVVSAMPWHRTQGAVEKLSMLFNVVSAMVASIGSGGTRRVAYGPFLAVRRDEYLRAGGHSNTSVRGAAVEDLALARVMREAVPTVASATQLQYRMYPLGARQLLEGWTKNTAIGAANVPRTSAALIVLWVISLCGGPFVSVWCYVLSVVQVLMISRKCGNFGPLSALLYPLHVAVFVVVAAGSAVRSAVIGSVVWRGRTIATR